MSARNSVPRPFPSNLALNLRRLIPVFAIYGAAIATCASVVVYSAILDVLMRRLVGTSSFIATLRA